MSRTYPHPSAGYDAQRGPTQCTHTDTQTAHIHGSACYGYSMPKRLYTCPLACSEEMTDRELAEHVVQTAEWAIAAMRVQYARNGVSDRAEYAADSIRKRYADMLHTALIDETPDWRNSDGLQGYADRITRTVTRESLELS